MSISVGPCSSSEQHLALSCCWFLLGDGDRGVYIHTRQQGGGSSIPPLHLYYQHHHTRFTDYTKKKHYHSYAANPCSSILFTSGKFTQTYFNLLSIIYKLMQFNTSAPEICVHIHIGGVFIPAGYFTRSHIPTYV